MKFSMKNKATLGYSVLMLLLIMSIVVPLTYSLPSGADITYNNTAGSPYTPPTGRNDSRGTITTLILDASQQVQTWKGYVGNVTGALSLKDADGNTLYDWGLSGVTITGQVYATRNDSVDFSAVSCANSTIILAETSFNNMTVSQSDNINNTFSYQNHTSFFVGAQPILPNTCQSTATYINSTSQTVDTNAKFQEVLLQQDNTLIYTTIIEDGELGYRNDANYDFQLIVAESPLKSTPTTFYFYTEIGSA